MRTENHGACSFYRKQYYFCYCSLFTDSFEAAKTFGYFLKTVNTEILPAIEDPIPGFLNFEKGLQIIRIH
jgi:hypothetical protein